MLGNNQRSRMKRYNAKVKKIRPEERDVYRSHAGGYVELHGGDDGESVEVGGLAWYSVELDEAGAAAFGEASNLVELEEAAVDTVCGAIENGVDVDQRKLNRTRGVPKGPITPLLMVADTGFQILIGRL